VFNSFSSARHKAIIKQFWGFLMDELASNHGALEQKYCSGCGKLLHKSARACPHCGAQLSGSFSGGEKSKVAAVLLALFLGGFGFHKFYLGRVGWGILYLIFFWTFIRAIVAFVEAIVYLTMKEDAFHAKYG